MQTIHKKLYPYRFQLFLATQLAILFGSLLFPHDFFEFKLLPLLYLISILAGILMISKHKGLMWLFIVLFTIAATIFGFDMISRSKNTEDILIRLSIYFVFHITVTWDIIKQVWRAERVTKNVIIGLMSGYISLGFLGFSCFFSFYDYTNNASRSIYRHPYG